MRETWCWTVQTKIIIHMRMCSLLTGMYLFTWWYWLNFYHTYCTLTQLLLVHLHLDSSWHRGRCVCPFKRRNGFEASCPSLICSLICWVDKDSFLGLPLVQVCAYSSRPLRCLRVSSMLLPGRFFAQLWLEMLPESQKWFRSRVNICWLKRKKCVPGDVHTPPHTGSNITATIWTQM